MLKSLILSRGTILCLFLFQHLKHKMPLSWMCYNIQMIRLFIYLVGFYPSAQDMVVEGDRKEFKAFPSTALRMHSGISPLVLMGWIFYQYCPPENLYSIKGSPFTNHLKVLVDQQSDKQSTLAELDTLHQGILKYIKDQSDCNFSTIGFPFGFFNWSTIAVDEN